MRKKGALPSTDEDLPGASRPSGAAPAPTPDAPAAELEHEAPAAAPAGDPPAPEAPVAEAAETPEAPAKSLNDEIRDSAADKVRKLREAEITGNRETHDVATLDEYAGAPSAPSQPRASEQPPAAAEEENAAGGGAPPETGGITIRVYGEEQTVTEDEVRAAGIATLQKERAGSYRIKQAQEHEARVRAYHSDLDAYRDRLQSMERDLRAGKLPDPGKLTPPNPAAPPTSGATAVADGTKIAEAAKAVSEAIYKGDPAATQKALETLITDVAQGRTATPPPVDVDAVAEAAAAKVEDRSDKRTSEAKRQEVNTTFQREFSTVFEHPEAFAVAKARFDALVKDPDNAGKSLVELAREAGHVALTRYPELKPAAAPPEQRQATAAAPAAAPAAATLENRRTLKARTVVRPSTGTARAPAPEATRPPTNKDYVAQLRASRGQPPV